MGFAESGEFLWYWQWRNPHHCYQSPITDLLRTYETKSTKIHALPVNFLSNNISLMRLQILVSRHPFTKSTSFPPHVGVCLLWCRTRCILVLTRYQMFIGLATNLEWEIINMHSSWIFTWYYNFSGVGLSHSRSYQLCESHLFVLIEVAAG